ncbi:MAG: carboxypeptidase-like regulatory domain-containing protein [Syntrophobacteraceae bacterium]
MRTLLNRCLLPVIMWVLILPALCSAGTVILGKVTDRAGEQPMAADVLVYRQDDGGSWSFAGSRPTNGAGEFKITFLRAGTYHLKIVHSSNCDPSVNYCADRYLEQYYNNIPLWDFENITKIVLKDGDQLVLDTARLKVRPFYFETVTNVCVPADADGMVRITRSVVNATGNNQWMLFWGVIDSPFRLDSKKYYGIQASYTFGQAGWELLKPGRNTISFTHRLGPKAIKGSYYYWIVGGDGDLLPMTPYLSGTFCKDVPETQCGDGSPIGAAAACYGHSAGLARTIPLRISAEGEVLESGPLSR